MDVKSAFLYGDIDTELYIEQPKMFEEKDRKTWVCWLKKGLYRLKQAGRIWNRTLHNHLVAHGYISLESEASIYSILNKKLAHLKKLNLNFFEFVTYFLNSSVSCDLKIFFISTSHYYAVNFIFSLKTMQLSIQKR